MTTLPNPHADRLIPMPEVMDITGLSLSYIHKLIRRGRFPVQFKPGGYASRWSLREVREWVEQQRQDQAA